MSFALTRMFAYFTLVMYLVVGSISYRVFMSETKTLSLSSSYLSLFTETHFKAVEAETLSVPHMAFSEIKLPAQKPAIKKISRKVHRIVKKAPKLEVVAVQMHELPFHEPVVLKKIEAKSSLPINLVSLYKDFIFIEPLKIAKESLLQDEISVKAAKSKEVNNEDSDLTFFAYESETSNENERPVKADKPVQGASIEEVDVGDLVAFDYSNENTEKDKAKEVPASAVGAMPSQAAVPAVKSKMAMQVISKSKSTSKAAPSPVASALQAPPGSEEAHGFLGEGFQAETGVTTHPSRLSVQVVSTNLIKTRSEVGFELRFQDDYSESVQDYNSGVVNLEQNLAQNKMTRSMKVLKRGLAPTNTDIILEEGFAEVSIPLLEEGVFNTIMQPYESRGPMGAVLVELDDETEGATLDVPYSEVILLDGDMKTTTESDYRYQLFVGVKTGNTLLGYRGESGEVISKIIHVHERELTFDSNYYEDVKDETVRLFEGNLLSKEKTPLIISSEQVKQFASDKKSKKINNHTHEMNFGRTLLGARRYLELTHQEEPVFVGFKKNTDIEIPSENFMRYILSKFKGSSLGNRCLVQLNLTKKASRVDVGAEPGDSTLAVYTQILDKDGRFYDSVSDKSEKVIVVGEHQGSHEYGQDGKINFKITYQDGSAEFLSSYCSANTYLIEQL